MVKKSIKEIWSRNDVWLVGASFAGKQNFPGLTDKSWLLNQVLVSLCIGVNSQTRHFIAGCIKQLNDIVLN